MGGWIYGRTCFFLVKFCAVHTFFSFFCSGSCIFFYSFRVVVHSFVVHASLYLTFFFRVVLTSRSCLFFVHTTTFVVLSRIRIEKLKKIVVNGDRKNSPPPFICEQVVLTLCSFLSIDEEKKDHLALLPSFLKEVRIVIPSVDHDLKEGSTDM